jgi:sugar phosphate isomerase/epimerase
MRREQLAINSVSTRHADLVEAVAAYAGAGFRNVEWVLPLVHDWLDAGHSVADLRALLQKYDVRSIGGFQAHVMCWGDDEARRANHVLHLRNAQLIDQLGGGTLVVGTERRHRRSGGAFARRAGSGRRYAGWSGATR